MKILYGIQGTGNGHTTRARHLVPALRQQGAQVDCVFSGRDAQQYFDMEVFGDYRVRHGLSFKTRQGKIDSWQTAKSLNLWRLYQEARELDLTSYDLILSDFEPVTAWAAKLQGRDCIGLSHQMSFDYPSVPRKDMHATDRLVIRYFAPVSQRIALHWHHFGAPILPPIAIAPQAATKQRGDFLVYLPFERLSDIEQLLSPFDDCTFYCYHPEIEAPSQQGPILWLPLCRDGFQLRLAQVQGVIANSGFELTSEVLQLGVQLLVKPLQGQFEQASNAQALLELGLADVMWQLSRDCVAQWMQRPSKGLVYYPDVATSLAQWLVKGQPLSMEQLAAQLWSQVQFPSGIANDISCLLSGEALPSEL